MDGKYNKQEKIHVGPTRRVKSSACPYCGTVLDGCTGVSNDEKESGFHPSSGDITICAICVKLCRFNEDLELEAVPEEEQKEFESEHPDLIQALRKACQEFNLIRETWPD